MGVVSIRIPDEQEAWLRAHGHKPGTFARTAVLKEIRRLEVEEAHAVLDGHAVPPRGMTSVEMIRYDRDYGHGPDRP